jgi:hypothetical protein
VSKRRVLALLVVLALGHAVFAAPAGSAVLHRTSIASNDETVGGPCLGKEHTGGGFDGGDDDRWGDLNPLESGNGDASAGDDTDGDDENELSAKARGIGDRGRFILNLRALFGFLVILL